MLFTTVSRATLLWLFTKKVNTNKINSFYLFSYFTDAQLKCHCGTGTCHCVLLSVEKNITVIFYFQV